MPSHEVHRTPRASTCPLPPPQYGVKSNSPPPSPRVLPTEESFDSTINTFSIFNLHLISSHSCTFNFVSVKNTILDLFCLPNGEVPLLSGDIQAPGSSNLNKSWLSAGLIRR
ncbi:hypothetical protein LIER_41461 [Lithospermum erythrorhizon]|uniref:Uncharacterized protein n=1 Tax=Lithospermum erythrorhizon TaxID=34254 RepID=A0AAV3R9N4_LITER